MEQTILYLNSDEAAKFILFQKYHSLFDTLDKNGVFDMNFGKVTINIAFGEVQNCVKEEMIYKK